MPSRGLRFWPPVATSLGEPHCFHDFILLLSLFFPLGIPLFAPAISHSASLKEASVFSLSLHLSSQSLPFSQGF